MLLFQLDLAVAFFWVSELTIIFVFILCILQTQLNAQINNFLFFSSRIYLIYIIFLFIYFYQLFFKNIFVTSFNFVEISDLILTLPTYNNESHQTDLYGFFLMFYVVNTFEFLCLMFLIFVITLILIQLYTFILFKKNFNNLKTHFELFYQL